MQDFDSFDLGENADKGYGDPQMTERPIVKVHEHVAKRVHLLLQRAGVPYEVEQQVCAGCAVVLDEKRLKRATG